MRSPTLTVKSWLEPGVAAPAPPPRPRSAALFGVFLPAQPAMASMATSATATGLRVMAAIRRIAASPSHLSDWIECPVTTLRLNFIQETGLTNSEDMNRWPRMWLNFALFDARLGRNAALNAENGQKRNHPREAGGGYAVNPAAATRQGPKRSSGWGLPVRYDQ